MRWSEEDLTRAILGLRVQGRLGRDRPKVTYEQVTRPDLRACGLDGTLAQD